MSRYAPDPAAIRARRFAVVVSFSASLALLAVKLFAWRLTGSTAVLSDALESVVHTFAIGFAAWSVFLASSPEDSSHPYGHGKIEFISAGVEGAFIILAAAWIVFDASAALLEGRHPHELRVGVLLTLSAAVITLGLGAWLESVGRRTGSVALVADGRHILTDSFTSFAVVIGLVLVQFTGSAFWDPVVAIAVAVSIAVSGGKLIRQAVGGLMDEADPELLAAIANALEEARTPECIELHRLRAWKAGDTLHVDAHLTVPRYASVDHAHGIMAGLERAVASKLQQRVHLLLHLDPCTETFCAECEMTACPLRTSPSHGRVAWVAERIIARPAGGGSDPSPPGGVRTPTAGT